MIPRIRPRPDNVIDLTPLVRRPLSRRVRPWLRFIGGVLVGAALTLLEIEVM